MANQQPQMPRKTSGFTIIWVSCLFVALLILSFPTVIILFFGMLPTFVAYIIDRAKEKYATYCVASLNFCGVFPYIFDLWIDKHTILAATQTLTNVFALFVMFGAAAAGWVLYTVIPPVIRSFLVVMAQHRVAALRTRQRKLIEEWGEAVAHAPDRPATAEQQPQPLGQVAP